MSRRIYSFLRNHSASYALVIMSLIVSVMMSISHTDYSNPFWFVHTVLMVAPTVYMVAAFLSVIQNLKSDIDELQNCVYTFEIKSESMVIRAEEAESMLLGERPTSRGHITKLMKMRVAKRSKFHCEYCGGKGDKSNGPDGNSWHIDHVVPVKRGGFTHFNNLVLSCQDCNLRKGDKPVYQFVRGMIMDGRGGR